MLADAHPGQSRTGKTSPDWQRVLTVMLAEEY